MIGSEGLKQRIAEDEQRGEEEGRREVSKGEVKLNYMGVKIRLVGRLR